MSTLNWSPVIQVTPLPDSSINDVNGMVENHVCVLDSGITVLAAMSDESNAVHLWAVDTTGHVGPELIVNAAGDLGFYGYADDPHLGAIDNLDMLCSLGTDTFGFTGRADESYGDTAGTPGGSGNYGHVASIFTVNTSTLVITRAHFIVQLWTTGVVNGNATSARWGDKMVITSSSNDSFAASHGGNGHSVWIVDSGTGTLTQWPINSTTYADPSAIAVSGNNAFFWADGGPSGDGVYHLVSMDLNTGGATDHGTYSSVGNNNYSFNGATLPNGHVAWVVATSAATAVDATQLAVWNGSTMTVTDLAIPSRVVGWTGGWFSNARSLSAISDGTLLLAYVDETSGHDTMRYVVVSESGTVTSSGDLSTFAGSTTTLFAAEAAVGGGQYAAVFTANCYPDCGTFGVYVSLTEALPPGIIRNLVINPSAEQSFDRAWTASNGRVETNVTWEV